MIMTQLSASLGTMLRVIRRFAGPLQDHDVPGGLKLLKSGCYAVHRDYFLLLQQDSIRDTRTHLAMIGWK